MKNNYVFHFVLETMLWEQEKKICKTDARGKWDTSLISNASIKPQ